MADRLAELKERLMVVRMAGWLAGQKVLKLVAH
jgi:hypothetical protein